MRNSLPSYPPSSAGISGVKVDCQAGVGLVGSRLGGGPRTALQVHTALEDSISGGGGEVEECLFGYYLWQVLWRCVAHLF